VLRSCLLLWVLVGCSAAPEDTTDTLGILEDTGVESTEPCSGAGPEAVALGSGGRMDFVPYAANDPLVLIANSKGVRGFYLEAMASGIDMRESVTIVYRVKIGDAATDDYLTRVGFMCDDLEGWSKSFLEFEASVDTDSLNGKEIEISIVVSNDLGEAASSELSLLGDPTW
jgi:hypothetical protein